MRISIPKEQIRSLGWCEEWDLNWSCGEVNCYAGASTRNSVEFCACAKHRGVLSRLVTFRKHKKM